MHPSIFLFHLPWFQIPKTITSAGRTALFFHFFLLFLPLRPSLSPSFLPSFLPSLMTYPFISFLSGIGIPLVVKQWAMNFARNTVNCSSSKAYGLPRRPRLPSCAQRACAGLSALCSASAFVKRVVHCRIISVSSCVTGYLLA